MTILEALSLAWAGLSANRLRSALTMLGITIGVGAVILLVAVGNGASISIQNQIAALGTNGMQVSPQAVKNAAPSQGFGSGTSLTYADTQAIRTSGAPHVLTAIPMTNTAAVATYSNQNWLTSVRGTTEDMPELLNYPVASGRFIDTDDLAANRRTAVIGKTVADNLFQGDDPIGKSIRINQQPFEVIGVFAVKGSSTTAGASADDIAVIPVTSFWAYLSSGQSGPGRRSVATIFVQATSYGALAAAKDEVTAILMPRHRISDPKSADFRILTQAELARSQEAVTGVLTSVLGAVAAISLVVGGIGIMNIMLVTVAERTREIGIRKAIGARRRDILWQFLIEAMVLSGVGGILGILLGVGLAAVLVRVSTGLPAPVVSPPSVMLAFGVSVLIGLFFGNYPANRAARLHPIQALRHE
jgi:putative ABC transport system permease protein